MASSSSSSRASSSSSSPCAACKHLRRKCTAECVFAPYFSAEQPQKFANVHRIFGASNLTKILSDLPQESRSEAVTSLAFEAEARIRDPLYGCVREISSRQARISELQIEIETLRQNIANLESKGIRAPCYTGLPPERTGDPCQKEQGSRPLLFRSNPCQFPAGPAGWLACT